MTSLAPLDELRASIAVPFNRARAMPKSVYTAPDFLALKEKHIFAAQWLSAGWADRLQGPGDDLTMGINDEPIIIQRDRDGVRRYPSNVCRHRMSTLLEGRGTVRSITCPDHAWTYTLDGSLRGAPAMAANESFCKDRITPIPGSFWYLALTPDGSDHVNVLYGGGMSADWGEDPAAEDHLTALKILLDAVNDEDKLCTEKVFRGLVASLSAPGPLSHLERPNSNSPLSRRQDARLNRARFWPTAQGNPMAHRRHRPFNTRDTYPEQQLDNDLAQAVVARGTTIFLRGQCPQSIETSQNINSHDPVEQTHKVMQNIRQLIEECGGSMEHLCKVVVYLTDVRHREAVYRTMGEYIKGVHPVSTGVVVTALARPDWLVEIDATAVIPD